MGWLIQLIADALGFGGAPVRHQANCASAALVPRFNAAATVAPRYSAAAEITASHQATADVSGC